MTNMKNKHLIIGPAGVGKTKSFIDEFLAYFDSNSEDSLQKQAFFILPNKEHVERIQWLLSQNERFKGYLNHHIVTLGDFIRYKATSNQAGRVITEFERAWVIGEILRRKDWEWMAQSSTSSSMAGLMGGFISEIKANYQNTQAFYMAAHKLSKENPYFEYKFNDLKRFLSDYDQRCHVLGLVDPEAEMFTYAAFLKQAQTDDVTQYDLLIFDGFFSFTASQLEFIDGISKHSKDTRIALTMDVESQRASTFVYPQRMQSILEAKGFVAEMRSTIAKRFTHPGLVSLERNLFTDQVDLKTDLSMDQVVQVVEAETQQAEVRTIAEDIVKSVQGSDKSFCDHMLILRSIDSYAALIEDVFTSMNIPFQIHERKRLSEYGWVRLLLLWFRSIDMDYEANQLILNSTLFCDFLKQINPVEMSPLQQLLISNPALIPLSELLDTIKEDEAFSESPAIGKCLDFLTNLQTLDNPINVKNHIYDLCHWIRGEDLNSNLTDTSEDKGCTEIIRNLIEKYAIQCRGEFKDIYRIMERIHNEIEMGLYSQDIKDQNRVQIYDTTLAMPKEYCIVYIPGLYEGYFPKRHFEGAVLKDGEREYLNSQGAGLDLMHRRNAGEKYFFYMAVTRATHRVHLSRPLIDADGRTLRPSSFFTTIQTNFMNEQSAAHVYANDIQPQKDEYYSVSSIQKQFVYEYFHANDTTRLESLFLILKQAATHKDGSEPDDLLLDCIDSLKPSRLEGVELKKRMRDTKRLFSATQLKMLKNCHYQYFAKYILRIHEAEEISEPQIEGTLIHRSLELLFRHFFDVEVPKMPGEAEFVNYALRCLDEAIEEMPPTLERRYHQLIRLLRLKNTLINFVKLEYSEINDRPDFVPSGFELDFGSKAKNPAAKRIVLKSGDDSIFLKGQIDRLDVNIKTKDCLVIDYKRTRGFSMKEFSEGLAPQALIYLNAAKQMDQTNPIGIEFVSIKDGKRNGIFIKDKIDSIKVGNHYANRFDQDIFEDEISKAAALVMQEIKSLRDLNIDADSKSCAHCSYYTMCRYEDWRSKV
ncbi:MAG: ATP-dependent helicase/DNAse subunit B [Candidatus Omnitrophota bacterium]|jgi:ATP-dependent helicase/DNAse subunit B